ncbi:MAG: hypothetical protein NW224_24430 [Leptolyngbyaceae cyanobacterium bins.302]|nr:hypothetical protein [Leptolyngbyaceae cyanobacterium bins.302]
MLQAHPCVERQGHCLYYFNPVRFLEKTMPFVTNYVSQKASD